MGDLRLQFHGTAQNVEIRFANPEYDVYDDTDPRTYTTLWKRALVSQPSAVSYVQQLFKDFVVVEGQILPFVMFCTTTDLPRHLSHDDRVWVPAILPDLENVDGLLFSISKVQVTNRFQDGIQKCLLYPERNPDGYDISGRQIVLPQYWWYVNDDGDPIEFPPLAIDGTVSILKENVRPAGGILYIKARVWDTNHTLMTVSEITDTHFILIPYEGEKMYPNNYPNDRSWSWGQSPIAPYVEF